MNDVSVLEQRPASLSEAAVRERELVARAQAGDVSAFEQIYKANAPRVYGLCLRLSGEATLAQELAQDVFVRAWQRLGSFRGESALYSWLYTMAVNMAYSERRSRKRRLARVTPTGDLTPFDKGTAPARPEAGVDLEKAIATLPPGARAVFVLHDVHGFKHEEIGGMLGLAVGTSKAQLHRARRLLREALAS